MRIASSLAYLDSSALFKLTIEEAESEALRLALRDWPRRVSSRLAVVEILRGVRRRDRSAEALARGVLTHVTLLALSDRLLLLAAALEPLRLRALDAIHVASALRLGPALTAFVSYDARQLEAAEALGLPAVSPR